MRSRLPQPKQGVSPPHREASSDLEQGNRLPGDVRAFFEPRLGHDFSQVRIHTGGQAAESAEAVKANAYTLGSDIVFGQGRYAPRTTEGIRLLAHELTHVVQQSRGGASEYSREFDGYLESDADGAADRISRGGSAKVSGSSGVRIARQGGPQIPAILSFLTPGEIEKLRRVGDSDFQDSLNTLVGHLRKTKGFTQQGDTQKFIDIRQAAGELRTFRDYVNDPEAVAVKVVPSATGGRSPDMWIRYSNNTTRRVEISNVTLASPDYRPDAQANPQGQVSPKIPKEEIPGQPGKMRVALPTNEFDDTAIKGAIRSKIKASSKGPSQLDAQNPNTRAGGAPMDPGGDVVVQITHGEVQRARLDQMIQELEPELVASSARRVQINSIDAAEPRAGRKIFEYNRSGQRFVGSVRQPNRPPVLEQPSIPKVGGMATPGGAGKFGVIKTVGGTIFAILVHFAFTYILGKIAQKLEESQIDSALKKIEPQIDERLVALTGEVLERQSASEQPVFATVKYSLNYMRFLDDASQKSLNFGASEHDLEGNKSMHDLRTAELVPFFRDAKLLDVKLASGEQPKDESVFSRTVDELKTHETQSYTFGKAIKLQRFSNVELRDYVLQQALPEEINAPEGQPPSARAAELRRRLDALQGTIAKEEAAKRADEERQRAADEKRKQEKLAQAREAQKAPPPPGPPMLPELSPAPKPQLTPQNDPLNLGGRPQQKTLADHANDAADIAEALKSELVREAEQIRRTNTPGALGDHRKKVEKWISDLRDAFEAWKKKGSPDWQSVQRMKFLLWWVDEPAGKSALMR